MFVKYFSKLFLVQLFLLELTNTGNVINNKEGYAGTLLEDIKNLTASELSLEEIVIVHKNIPILYEGSIANLISLKVINMYYDNIREIQPHAFYNLLNLEEIHLRGNRLNEIKVGVFNNLPIRFLNLCLNQISTIESGALDYLPKLETLWLDDNKIAVWNNEWLKHSPSITFVSLDYNELEELPSFTFKYVKQMKHPLKIDLTFNNNRIKKIYPDAFKNLHHIAWLDLSRNKLNRLDYATFEGIQVDHLILEDNKIECLQDLNKLKDIRQIELQKNPIRCDCYKRIKEWRQQYNITIKLDYFKTKECGTEEDVMNYFKTYTE